MKKSTLVFSFFILAKFLLQYIAVHPDFELHRDEFLHLDQARHLAWGYLSVPPFTSWVSLLIQFLGGGEFWTRLFPAFFGALTIALVWDLVKRLGGNLFAQSLASVALLCSAMIRLNMLYQPNSVDILCFTLVPYTLIRYFEHKENKWLYGMALTFALAALNKYNIAFLGFGLLPALLITKQGSLFSNKHLYYSILLLIVLILPNVIWQINHGFPVLRHMELLKEYQLVNNSRLGFWKDQVLFFFPSLILWLLGLIYVFTSRKTKKYRFIGWTYIFTMGIFTYLHAKGYYAIGMYPALIAFGSVWVSQWIPKESNRGKMEGNTPPVVPEMSVTVIQSLFSKKKYLLQTLILIIPPVLFSFAFDLIHPFYSPEKILESPPPYSKLGLNTWEDGKEYPIPQDFSDMLGWSELAGLVDEAYAQMPKDGRTLIICDNYGEAGAINFYTKTPGLEAFTMNADYLYWFDLEEPVDNLILVWMAQEKITDREINFFEEYKEIGKVTNPLSREKGTTVHYLRGAKVDVNSILEGEIKEKKQLWEERD
ncbi:ArnT family glycosyltransferase [Algoriphagus sp. PAP.12]|uniref:ArnT family glycosyltransferase n=1 Tax=Algoriphagus sp. PAP.12 TaxID=2996678 RepID=UPI00227C7C57|nr:glycosyltransferase family 39 protein [Algoriphagus sp. PAP.12]